MVFLLTSCAIYMQWDILTGGLILHRDNKIKSDAYIIVLKVTQISKNRLRTFAEDAKSRKQPFFLAAGFYKPHMPLVCGEEFWDHYPLEKMDMPEYGYLPQGYPEAAYYASDEFVGRGDLKEYDFKGEMNETFPEDAVKMLRRAYFACVSFIDHQVSF